MSGDLGNLLTGELGEAEARFSHEDFAALYGRRIAGRVRRRRAVRAAGVSGGTMLTAGALVVGATQVPWGTLGTTTGVGASDCVTPSATDGWQAHSASIDTSEATSGELVINDFGNDTTILRGVRQPDGTFLFTDGQGNPLSATPGVGGYYTVELPPGAYYDDVTRSISLEPGGAGSVSSQQATSTPSASTETVTVRVTFDGSENRPSEFVVMDYAGNKVLVRGVESADRTFVFTDADGNPVEASPDGSGGYTMLVRGASVDEGMSGGMTSLDSSGAETGMVYYTVEGPGSVASPSASDDCFTADPTASVDPTLTIVNTYSADPSLAAKPDDVIGDSPFECGFVMDSQGHGSSEVAVTDYAWIDPADFNATLQERWPTATALTFERGTSPMPVAKVRVTQDQSVFAGGFGPGEPTDETAGTADGSPMVNTGASFVGVQDGVVVATADTATEGTEGENSHFFLDYDGTTHSLTLVNASDAFIACPGQTFDPATGTIFAVAGSYVLDKSGVYSTDVEYSWAALERN